MIPVIAAAGRTLLGAGGGPGGIAGSVLQAVIPGVVGQLTNPPQPQTQNR